MEEVVSIIPEYQMVWVENQDWVLPFSMLTYSSITDLDIEIIGQLFFADTQPEAYLVYGLLKWSF